MFGTDYNDLSIAEFNIRKLTVFETGLKLIQLVSFGLDRDTCVSSA